MVFPYSGFELFLLNGGIWMNQQSVSKDAVPPVALSRLPEKCAGSFSIFDLNSRV
jgi:hypothetical protein